MELLAVQIVATFGAFVILILAGVIPFCIVRCTDDWKGKGRGSSSPYRGRGRRSESGESGGGAAKLLSISNCFACGIFLSTCFLGLIPHVRMHGSKLRRAIETAALETSLNVSLGDASADAVKPLVRSFVGEGGTRSAVWTRVWHLPETELLIVLGFLFILVLEQSVLACHRLSTAADSSPCRRRRGPSDEFEFQPLVGAIRKRQGKGNGKLSAAAFQDSSSESESEIAIKRGTFEAVSLSDAEEAAPSKGRPRSPRVSAAPPRTSLSIRSVILLLGLGIHAVFEGLALGVQTTPEGFRKLLFGVMLHEVLCSLAFGLSLAQQKAPLGTGFMSLVLLAMTIPLGMLVGLAVPKTESFETIFARYLLEGLAAGIFVYVACVEMLGAELNEGGGHSHGGGDEDSGHGSKAKEGTSGLCKAAAVVIGFLTFLLFSLMSSA